MHGRDRKITRVSLALPAFALSRRRLMGAVVLAVGGLTVGATAAAAEAADDGPVRVATVDEMIDRLRDDPILVQPSMGMGDSALAHDVLTEAASGAELPVYVVLAQMPEELADGERPGEQVAVLLRDELGDGVYHVEFLGESSYTGVWGAPDEYDFRDAYIALRNAEENGPGEYPRASALFEAAVVAHAAASPGQELPQSVVDDYASRPWAFIPESTTSMADAKATRWVATLATVIGVLIAGIIVTLGVVRAKPLKTKAGVPARRSAHETVPEQMADRARKRLASARRRFEALPGTELTADPGEKAARAIDAAERVLDTGDELDAVGAYVLALIADREVDRVKRPERPAFRPCFINPLHGESHDTVRVGGSSIDAPVCSTCGRQQGAFLSVRKGIRGWAPYVETDTVWAWTGYGALVGDLADQVLADRGVRR
ncbi:hypothetical protein [Phytoactinopolyspora halotolerans]|uniref:Uncharacterized protein n=1 Tax=Phytoactinopolyspora halotolerans TaxID=1981512 RepID=A0A6L9SBH8_9ACTN|nr:hypothetical protein [Phytoactinopolyspora halotolerans]NEE02429.1 hypothetical protein [Phytoactinopolyspora halotolerans]